jgi:hypothetical protein
MWLALNGAPRNSRQGVQLLILSVCILGSILYFRSRLLAALAVLASVFAQGQVPVISLHSPKLVATGSANLVSPIHVQATAQDTITVTGYVVYVDNVNVFRNFAPSLDTWIALSPGAHTLYLKAWDSASNAATRTYSINIVGFAPPTPPAQAHRFLNIDVGTWTADNNPDVGGNCNHGSVASFPSSADPNTANLPTTGNTGQHFVLASGCQYDDSLFIRKYSNPSGVAGSTNFLWDFWFYVPTSTQNSSMQALEFDMFQALQLSDGVHEFMFGSQCNYSTNRWQLWLPHGTGLTWVDAGTSPCRTSTGAWHHATYFLQRVMSTGYQEIPLNFNPGSDRNSSLRFGTLTVDGHTLYLGGVAWSTIPRPAWSPVIGVQHQLDSAVNGAILEEYVAGETLTTW